MFSPQDTANLLVEALPYFQEFSGKTIVVKYGGNAMISEELKEKVMQDVTLMKQVGLRPVIVHGGGPDITGFMKKVGKDTEFVSGLRVTDEETMEIVGMVLIGKVNADIVTRLNVCGNRAIGLSGVDAELIRAKKKLAVVHEDGGEQKVDIGHVGEVESINAKILEDNLDRGYVPVVAPIGVGEDGAQYNINADYVAAAIAGALKAEKLLLLTDVEGVYKNYEDKRILILGSAWDKNLASKLNADLLIESPPVQYRLIMNCECPESNWKRCWASRSMRWPIQPVMLTAPYNP